jgi:hypothetical protein
MKTTIQGFWADKVCFPFSPFNISMVKKTMLKAMIVTTGGLGKLITPKTAKLKVMLCAKLNAVIVFRIFQAPLVMMIEAKTNNRLF